MDIRTGQCAISLSGHIACLFSCDWHPAGNLLATGGEDHSTRIFDIRHTKQSYSRQVLGARMAPIRNVQFSPDGHILGAMEELDFVTFYDVPSFFTRCTSIDFFGEASGFAFSQDSQLCYLGISEFPRGGILELRRPSMASLARLECLSL